MQPHAVCMGHAARNVWGLCEAADCTQAASCTGQSNWSIGVREAARIASACMHAVPAGLMFMELCWQCTGCAMVGYPDDIHVCGHMCAHLTCRVVICGVRAAKCRHIGYVYAAQGKLATMVLCGATAAGNHACSCDVHAA